MIIVDEAQLLKRAPMVDCVSCGWREVNEVPGNGVVLIGNSELYEAAVKKGKITTAGLHAHWTAAGLQHDAADE